jgi:uncharacterized protein
MFTSSNRWTAISHQIPVPILRSSAATHPYIRKVAVMDITSQEDLKAHLMATDEEFRSLAQRHAQYHKELEELEAKSRLTLEDEAEEQRLKKQKLRLKDQMNQIMARYRAQQVA